MHAGTAGVEGGGMGQAEALKQKSSPSCEMRQRSDGIVNPSSQTAQSNLVSGSSSTAAGPLGAPGISPPEPTPGVRSIARIR